MPRCKNCQAEILWVEMASGKKMPLDSKPVSMIEVKEGIGQVVQVYRAHWATCPGADSFSKPPPPDPPPKRLIQEDIHAWSQYEDPEHEWNSSKYHTGEKCITPGCDRPAGTKWGAYWCQICNADRLHRISDQFESLLKKD